MKNYYSTSSKNRLESCHPDLQRLFTAVLEEEDHTIVCGYRNSAAQERAFTSGKSKVQYPDSKHNVYPSTAVDAAPYDEALNNINWDDEDAFIHFAEKVIEKASELGIKIRWGGDWDGDGDRSDQSFDDLVHFELIL